MKSNYRPISIFLNIVLNKNHELETILNQNPTFIEETHPNSGETPIFYAIDCNNNIAVNSIISKFPEVLEQKNSKSHTPIFHAIESLNEEAVRIILEKKPTVIHELDKKNFSPFEFAIENYIRNKDLNEPDEEIAKSRNILNLIYKKQFNTDKDLTDNELQSMINYLSDISHVKLGYNINKDDFGLYGDTNRVVYKNILSQDRLDKDKELNPFLDIALSSLDSINNFDKPIRVGNEKLFIFKANLKKHYSYFIFHVNDDNKLTKISYCDGNKASFSDLQDLDSNSLRGGVKIFSIKNPIEFSEDFKDRFLSENIMDSELELFYAKLECLNCSPLQIVNPENDLTEEISSYDYAIPTKEQIYGNCGYKSLKILWRYIAKLQNPELDFSSRHVDMAERRLDIESQSSDLQDATVMFKKFKGDVTISAVERLIEFKEKLKQDVFSQEFRDFFTHKIDKTLEKIKENSEIKIQKNIDSLEDDVNLATHQKIKNLIENHVKSPDKQEPRDESPDEQEPRDESQLRAESPPSITNNVGCFNALRIVFCGPPK